MAERLQRLHGTLAKPLSFAQASFWVMRITVSRLVPSDSHVFTGGTALVCLTSCFFLKGFLSLTPAAVGLY